MFACVVSGLGKQPSRRLAFRGGIAGVVSGTGTIAPVVGRVHSFILQGIEATPCEIEVDLTPAGLPKTTVVGLPDVAVKESIVRVRTAMLNSGFRFPHGRVTINLAPAHLRKEGPVYDLPIALALLRVGGTIAPAGERPLQIGDFLVGGELALDGRVRQIKGVVSLAQLASELGRRGVIVPRDNAAEAAVVEGVEVLGVESIGELAAIFNGHRCVEPHPPVDIDAMIGQAEPTVDFADVRGQEAAKRALTIAAAGAHNILLIGPAGTGERVAPANSEDRGPTTPAGTRSRFPGMTTVFGPSG